jgi:hypothetical protein
MTLRQSVKSNWKRKSDLMVRVTIIVREVGRLKPDYSLYFDLPQVPAVGDYISVQRPDEPEPYGEDLIVRQIWWRLKSPETATVSSGPPKIGGVSEIFVECDPAIGPWTSDRSRDYLTAAYTGRAMNPLKLHLERVSVRQDAIKKSE